MSESTNPSNTVRTVALAVTTWGLVAAALTASRVLEGQGLAAAFVTAAGLAAIAAWAYALDEELRAAASATPKRVLQGWALAFDAAALALLAIAAVSPAPLGIALWKGVAPMAALFAAPLAVAFHAAARDGRRALAITISGPVKSPVRSPAGT